MQMNDLAARVLAYADGRNAAETPFATEIDGLGVSRARAPTPLAAIVYQPIFCLVLQGEKQALLGERTVSFGRGQSVIVSLDLPTSSRIVKASRAEPYVALALRLDAGLLRELAAEMEPVGQEARGGAKAEAIAAGEVDAAILDAFARLFGLVGKPADTRRVLAPLILREIHFWLLRAGHGAMLRELARADSHAAGIARAVAVIKRDYALPLRVADLARVAGMSPSGFHDHFKAVTGTTPLQFQKRLRLMEARRLLLGDDVGVSAAAFEVGYESPTQFSREYARQFGQSPRADKRQLRAGDLEIAGGDWG